MDVKVLTPYPFEKEADSFLTQKRVIMNLFASKILDTNIKSCLTQKRVEQILLHDTNSILQIPNKVENSKLIGSKLELNKVDRAKFAFSYKKEESSLIYYSLNTVVTDIPDWSL